MQRVLMALVFCINVPCALAATWQIVYPKPSVEMAENDKYPVALLTLALEQTGVRYELRPSEKELPQGRSLKHLAANLEINVVWSMTDAARERELLPIRIPIYKGLIGWRLLVTEPSNLKNFANIGQLSELTKYQAIQGQDWPDTKILQANGFDVVSTVFYDRLYSLLPQHKNSFYPRSVLEVWLEKENVDEAKHLAIEPTIGLHYPTAAYFFVNKQSVTLARLLTTGLERAIENGKFDELFYQHHHEYLQKANMGQRHFFELNNPILPEETPLQRTELWYSNQ